MEATEEIKSRLDIADLIGEYLPLKPAGSGAFKATCPFHQEKTPSFYVSRSRQTWHCFGCNEGGDHFTFVMKMEGMEFREALELLAQKTGVVLPKFDGEKSTLKKRLHEINTLAMKAFRGWLQHLPEAEVARAYVKRRGLDALTVDLFLLGYAADSWDALVHALGKEGVAAHELVQAGLAIKRERGEGVYDRFRGRLMFPIADVHGNIAGFTARLLDDHKQEAKYVNTPETDVYRKSAILYGLDKAKGAIRQQNQAVIVEGNMDVIGSHQFGVEHVVASSGTALTLEQLALLKRFATNLAIAFDADAAGNAATVRGLDLARQQDFSIRIITLPPEAGKDPDDAVRKDPQIWKDAIKNAVGIMEWLYRNAFRHRNVSDPSQKKMIARDLLPEIRRIADPVERDHWLRRLAEDLGVRLEALLEALGTRNASHASRSTPSTEFIPHFVAGLKTGHHASSGLPSGTTRGTPQAARTTKSPEREMEALALACLLSQPEHFFRHAERNGLRTEHFIEQDLSTLYSRLRNMYVAGQITPLPAGSAEQPIRLTDEFSPEETKIMQGLAFLVEREYPDRTSAQLEQEVARFAVVLRERWIARERRGLEQDMREAERTNDETRIAEITRRFASLQ